MTVVLLLNASFGALAVGGYIELRHKEWSRLRGVDLSFVYGALAVVAAGDVWFSWWLFRTTQSQSRWVYLTIAALGLAVGGWHSWQRLWPHHENSGEQRWTLFGLLSALLGFGLGTILAIAGLATSAYWHNIEQETGHRIPIVTDVQGLYFALGDSYSAGEGLGPPWGAGTESTGCHRSMKQAYAQLLISPQGPLLKPTDFTACSGAIVADIFKGTTRHGIHVPPQVDGKVHRDVHLLTLTIGGNNVLFSKIVTFCFEEAHCLSATFPPPGVSSGPEHVKPGPLASSWAPATALAVGKEDAAVFRQLKRDFPNSRIVVVGYPYLFPDGKAGLWPPDCSSILRRFGQPERQGIRALQDDFNNLTYEEAEAVGIEFVSPNAIWRGHEPCGDAGQYTNSIKPLLSFDNPFLTFRTPLDGGTFHPNGAGQQTLAALVACYLDTYPTAPDLFVNGVPHRLDVPATHFVRPAELGLRDAPGADKPLPGCS
ncbi:MAG: SGNH/GDSL hydrolase family protein [Micromonosporaceae bacterium]